MRTSVVLASLLAASVVAKPIRQRDYVTEDIVFVVTTTITESPTTESTAVPQNNEAAAATTTVVATSQATSAAASSGDSTSSASSAVGGAAGSSAYQQAILTQHNIHRANHSAPDLVWDDDLANTAQTIASTCVYAHSMNVNGGGYGQNIGAGTSAEEIGQMITNEMYNGEFSNYPQPFGNDNPDMSNFEKWGHMSQIVWKGTTSVGCATVQCNSLSGVSGDVPPVFSVCNYKPPGNFAGQYSNVQAPLGQSTVTV